MKITKNLLKTIVITFLASSAIVNAAEYGSSQYLPGFYGDFGMAIGGASGTYLSNFFWLQLGRKYHRQKHFII